MILVTGGAGYVGRNVARVLGKEVLAVDDLRNSWRGPDGVPLIQKDLAEARVDWSAIDAVIHCAGSMDVAESVRNPEFYFRNNVEVPRAFFAGARGKPLVFSSTCQVYGEPERLPVPEDHPTRPINPYGESKLAAETMLRELGVRLTVLRYFNAAGGDQRHRHETHLIPRVLEAALLGRPVTVHGDGSAIRDYVHVEDLARAHVKALEKPGTYNLGSGRGASVLEVIEAARRVTGRKIEVLFGPARPGDPRGLVADITRARRELGWEPRRTLEEIVASVWEWRRSVPGEFGG
jgi:UDP-glucose-4-epimerase GalE